MARQRKLEAIEQAEYVTICELVRLTGARYSTLKYYTECGLLPYEQQEERLTRRYRRTLAIQRLEEIRQLKQAGYSVAEIQHRLGNE